MQSVVTYVFDGSFDGLLSAVFDSFELKNPEVKVVSAEHHAPSFLIETHDVFTTDEKSERVWNGVKKKLGVQWCNRIYSVYLSELPEAFQHIFDFLRLIFTGGKGVESDFGHPAVIGLTQIERKVSRERHRMKAFIRFEKTIDGIFYAPIEPDFNVLPLVVGFFKDRFADQQWLIFDLRRKYGMFYDKEKVSPVSLEFADALKSESPFLPLENLDEKEQLYGVLWKDYFKNTNIPARKNMKLHLQNVPKRYWKYLTEKKS